jgi:aryl-alcohol dehydrogenase-like predicted oxidoreductase
MTNMRTLGSSDIKVSTVGVGCNAFGTRIDEAQTKAVVDAAFAHGVNFFDTADSYGRGESEELLGKALQGRRDEVVIATKFGMDVGGLNGDDGGRRGTAAYVKKAAESSLKRLGTDHIDLYQLHTPDPSTPIEETLGALNELVVEGKVRAIGSSNLQAWQLVDADWVSKTKGFASFVTAQNEYSLYNPAAEVELTPACLELGVGILPYFPIAYGLLTGKYRRGEAAPKGTRLEAQAQRLETADWDRIEALEAFAAARNISILQLAIGGLAAKPAVSSVIAGATKPEQVAANAAAGEWIPSEGELKELSTIVQPGYSYTTFAPR